MDLNYFDLIIGSIILLLGLKGIINGFFKEVFGLIGIVGGVFIASRFSNEAGTFLSNLIFKFDNESAINLTGFLVVLAVFWAVMILLGILFKKLSSASGLGIFDRILGFVFGASKFFLIVSIIAFAVNNVKTIRENLKTPMKNSILFPILVQTGGFIMKLDPVDNVEELKNSQEKIQKKIDEAVEETVKEKLNDTKEVIEEKTQEIKEDIKNGVDKQLHGE